jgi:hypothetical protein
MTWLMAQCQQVLTCSLSQPETVGPFTLMIGKRGGPESSDHLKHPVPEPASDQGPLFVPPSPHLTICPTVTVRVSASSAAHGVAWTVT